MIHVGVLSLIILGYFALLFAAASWAEHKGKKNRSIIANPTVYTLSMAVFCTSWTFYGSVGRAATTGLDFIAIYLGPTLMAFTWWFFLRKMLRVSKELKLVSIADFISSRYGKSVFLGAVVTIFAVIGIMPYIALQIKAVSETFTLIASAPGQDVMGTDSSFFSHVLRVDTTLILALLLGLFSVIFGARHLDASERHEGLVAAIALESVVKLFAFLMVGVFVTYGLFDGFGDIFAKFLSRFPEKQGLLLLDSEFSSYTTWATFIVMSMMAFMFLPRQFHIMVVENTREKHILEAMWRFPAYLFLINIFVIPVALGGLLLNDGDAGQADYFVVSIPLMADHLWLGLLVFVGGFSAAAGMVMLSSVALSTMMLNNLLMPVILKIKSLHGNDISGLLINLKRICIFVAILVGYGFYNVIGESYTLVKIGFISFIGATQFAPAVLFGLYWKRANRIGVLTGLILGFIVWFYTLLVPSFVFSGWLGGEILEDCLLHLGFLCPLHLFGMQGLDMWSHSLLWTMFFNVGALVSLSFLFGQDEVQKEQAARFVDIFSKTGVVAKKQRLSKAPTADELMQLMSKFIGEKKAQAAISAFLGERRIVDPELPEIKDFTERTLAGYVGSALARIIVENYLAARGSRMEDVFDIFGSVNISRAATREQLQVLFEAAKVVASGQDLQTIMDNLLDLLTRQFPFDLCVVRIVDEQGKKLRLMSQKGMSMQHLDDADREVNLDTVIGEAFLTNTIQVVNDTDGVERPVSAKIMQREGITSFAHAPIAVEGRPVGVLSAFSRTDKGIFTEEFIEVFESIAAQLGIAWRNARQTERLIAARQYRRELEIAKNIQLGLLPTSPPDVPGASLAGVCVTADHVGGDYYDFLVNDDDSLDLVIADVSGHNIAAALIMAEVRTFIQAQSLSRKQPSRLSRDLNRFFHTNLVKTEMFITMFYLKYYPQSREIAYSNAGHNLPLIWKSRRQEFQVLDAEGLILGIKPEVEYEEKTERLEPGDVLVLYTDGITEARNQMGDFFGEQRLCSLIREQSSAHPHEVIDHLLNQLQLFTGSENFKDDISMVVMRIEGESDP
ncbi:SpoIIE family protein phosphatase [Desulfovermiculus halophilus]|uniref:SpoIIE family protein phosphatase n=1 Tax=Desulfovermiculus halophilus TaxID=339722 RepID=UPI000480CB1C|nr:SpoIIE family protein phosphatase [Desulfovermiculus halophilus]